MLASPARYLPIDKGLYEVAPGLFPLGHDFGQGDMDHKVFQLDNQFGIFRANVEACRQENLRKYFCEQNLPENVRVRAVRFFCEQLSAEWPLHFQFSKDALGYRLDCKHTNETLEFDPRFALRNTEKYASAFDAFRNQIQEDFAITIDDGTRDYLGLLHVCGPSHWAPRQKLGKNFFDVHAIVPGSEKLTKASRSLVQAMIHKGPFVRFVWSFVTDKNLNHHPDAPPGFDPIKWKGRAFNKEAAIPFYLRVERQVTFGLPDVSAGLFFIRLSFVDGTAIKANHLWRDKLVSSLRSMSPESRRYKGVEHCFDDLIEWLLN